MALPLTSPHILYRSDTLLAVDKPQGCIVHGDGTGAVTLTDAVRARIADDPSLPASAARDLQALQRLDRDTSGVVAFSLSKATQPVYDRMMSEHRFTKRYLAIVAGSVPWGERVLDQPIGRDRHDARRMRVSRTGKPALTLARPIERVRWKGRDLTLLSIEIKTGRKHQIRVHLAAAGFPILGDELYGAAPRPSDGARRATLAPTLMLHATELSFVDPITSERVRIVSPAPARMRALVPQLKH